MAPLATTWRMAGTAATADRSIGASVATTPSVPKIVSANYPPTVALRTTPASVTGPACGTKRSLPTPPGAYVTRGGTVPGVAGIRMDTIGGAKDNHNPAEITVTAATCFQSLVMIRARISSPSTTSALVTEVSRFIVSVCV